MKLFELTNKLLRCFESPTTTLDTMQLVQDDLVKVMPTRSTDLTMS